MEKYMLLQNTNAKCQMPIVETRKDLKRKNRNPCNATALHDA
jgi:hypothetical protein